MNGLPVWDFFFLVAIVITGFLAGPVCGTEKVAIPDQTTAASEAGSPTELTISRFCLAYTPLGPERMENAVYPGERVIFCLVFDHLSQDSAGLAEVSFELEVMGPDGRVIERNAQSLGKSNWHRRLPGSIGFQFPATTEPGVYTLRVTFKDTHANTSKTITEAIKVKPIEFALVSPSFFHDKRLEVPAACGCFSDQPLNIRFTVIGENRAVDKHTFDVVAKVIDKQDRIEFQFSNSWEVEARPLPHVPMRMDLNFRVTTPGTYTMVCTVTERSTGKTATHVLPLVVVDPFASND